MALTSVDLDPQLIERARVLIGAKSNCAVLDLALRRVLQIMSRRLQPCH